MKFYFTKLVFYILSYYIMKNYIYKRLFNKVYNEFNWNNYWIDKEKTIKKIKKLFNKKFLYWWSNDSIKKLVNMNIIHWYLYYLNKELNNKFCYWSNWNNDFYIHWIDKYTLSNKEIKKLNKRFWII